MDPVFLIIAGISVGSALLVVTRTSPVYSAIWLLVCFLSFAILYIKLSAPFLAAIHVLVYTGAILVLFLFVIMLLNLKDDEMGEEPPRRIKGIYGLCSAILFGFIAWPIIQDESLWVPLPTPPEDFGSVENVGRLLFNEYALPFELVSVLIVAAMFGALVLSKRTMGR
jgi:NADH-quinone oxidoreductase subunit J